MRVTIAYIKQEPEYSTPLLFFWSLEPSRFLKIWTMLTYLQKEKYD